MLQDCVECMGVGANMARSDNIAEEGTRAVSAIAQGASVAKELGDVRYVPRAPSYSYTADSVWKKQLWSPSSVQATVTVLYLEQMALGWCKREAHSRAHRWAWCHAPARPVRQVCMQALPEQAVGPASSPAEPPLHLLCMHPGGRDPGGQGRGPLLRGRLRPWRLARLQSGAPGCALM